MNDGAEHDGAENDGVDSDGAEPPAGDAWERAKAHVREWAAHVRGRVHAWRARHGAAADDAVVPFVLAVRDGAEAAAALGALAAGDREGGGVDDLLEVAVQALRPVPVAVLKAQRVRLEQTLSALDDALGAHAYALTVLVSACIWVEADGADAARLEGVTAAASDGAPGASGGASEGAEAQASGRAEIIVTDE